jgi:hypothetical protein
MQKLTQNILYFGLPKNDKFLDVRWWTVQNLKTFVRFVIFV